MQKTLFSRDYKILLHQLREARTRAGLSQEALAERIGQTQSFVSKCERGERRLDVLELRQYCQAVSIPLTSFVRNLEKLLAS